MKVRLGFISNSSSSSFIIIDASEGYDRPIFLVKDGSLNLGDRLGRIDFASGPQRVSCIGSRINFAYIQADDSFLNGLGSSRLRMLDRVIKDMLGPINIWRTPSFEDAYVDHQSSASEGKNCEMFDSHQSLKDFLFGKGSYIQLDHDNH